MKRINPLIIIPSPRDIEEFKDATKLLRFDKLWLKYYNEDQAYSLARNWFLEHKDYTHMIILPDDLIVGNSDIVRLLDAYQMMNSLLSNQKQKCKVISGWCRCNSYSNLSTVTMHLPPDPPYGLESYRFATIKDIEHGARKIVKVGFTSFALSLIERDIIEQIEFRNVNSTLTDLYFSRDCWDKKITQWVDTGIKLKHLKINDDYSQRDLQVGKRMSYMQFEPRRGYRNYGRPL